MRLNFYLHKFFLFVILLLSIQILNAQSCVTFNNLPTGHYETSDGYPFGTPFWTENGAEAQLAPYHLSNGGIRNNVFVTAGSTFWSGAFIQRQGQVIRMLEASVAIDFTGAVSVADQVSFDFLDWEGNVNLSINGEPVLVNRSFNELPTQVATHVTMTVSDVPAGVDGRRGSVSFSGPIYHMTIGGTELGIDNLCFSPGVEPACTITHVFAEPETCDDLTGAFNLSVDFNSLNQSNQINVTVNNSTFGPFDANDKPYSVGPFFGDGITSYIVEVTDVTNASCSNETEIDPVTCEINTSCNISDLTINTGECTGEDQYSATINFNRITSASSNFVVTIDNEVIGAYAYSSLPLTINNLQSNGIENKTLFVCDAEDTDCCLQTSFETLDCTPPCMIEEILTTVGECNDDGMFNITVDLVGQGLSEVVFILLNEDDYGEFNTADFPINIGPLRGDGALDYQIDILDTQDFDCFNSTIVENVFCEVIIPCAISDLNVETIECSGVNEYAATINFDRTSSPTDQFVVRIGGETIGTYPYASFPLTLNNLESNGVENKLITVCDASDQACCLELIFQTLDCRPDCSIDAISAEATDCNPNDRFQIVVDIAGTTLSSMQSITINGENYGSFATTSFPVTIGSFDGDGSTVYQVIVSDNEDPDCQRTTSVDAPRCGPLPVCEISNLTATPGNCTGDNMMSLTVNFETGELNTGSFMLTTRGITYGPFDYDDLPLTLSEIPTAGIGTEEVEICDATVSGCCSTVTYQTLDCAPAGECTLSDLSANPGDCTGENTYSLGINFTHANATSGAYLVTVGNSTLGPISYENLPLTINNVTNNSNLVQTLTVCDSEDPDCCITITYTEPDCAQNNCNISEVSAERMDCQEGAFMVMLNASYINPGSAGFQVIGNGENYGNFAYSELPVMLGPFDGDGVREYEFVIEDIAHPNCSNFTTVPAYDCMTECSMGEVEIVLGDCTDEGEVEVVFIFESDNNSGKFTIHEGNNFIDEFNYADGPAVFMLDGTALAPYNLIIQDMEATDCRQSIPLGPFGCTTNTTSTRAEELTNVKVYTSESTNMLTIEMPESNMISNINIYNVHGQRILQDQYPAGTPQHQMNISQLNSGIFFCEIIQNGKRATTKFHHIR